MKRKKKITCERMNEKGTGRKRACNTKKEKKKERKYC